MQAYAIPSSAEVADPGAQWLEREFPGLIACIRANDQTPQQSGVRALLTLATNLQTETDQATARNAIQIMAQTLAEVSGHPICGEEFAGRGHRSILDSTALILDSTASGLRSFFSKHKNKVYIGAAATAVVGVVTGGYYLLTGSSGGE